MGLSLNQLQATAMRCIHSGANLGKDLGGEVDDSVDARKLLEQKQDHADAGAAEAQQLRQADLGGVGAGSLRLATCRMLW